MQRKTQQERDDQELEQFLKRESTAFAQDKEVERILSMSHAQDPFCILDMDEEVYIKADCTEREVCYEFISYYFILLIILSSVKFIRMIT